MRARTRRRYDVKFLHRALVSLHWARTELIHVPNVYDSLPLFEPILIDLEEAFLGLYGEPIEYREHPDTAPRTPSVRLRHATDFVEIAAVSLAGVSVRRRNVLPLGALRDLLWHLRDHHEPSLLLERTLA